MTLYERHVNSLSQVVESGIDVIDTYTCMLLNGTVLNSKESRAKYRIGSHFRILPRDFARLGNGRIAVEIEEIVSSTDTMSFADYVEARKLHFMVAVVYNGGGFGALLRMLRQKKVSIIRLLQLLVTHMQSAPSSVREIFDSFVKLTKEELWDSEEELRAYVYRDGNYEKLLGEKLGTNLIQTHTAKSLAVMDDFVEYVFEVVKMMIQEQLAWDQELEAMCGDIRHFVGGRTHNLFGEDRNDDVPCFTFSYDIPKWMLSSVQSPLSEFKFDKPVPFVFTFSESKREEMASLIKRYGTTATGIGRIIIQMNRSRVWRDAVAS